MEEKFQQIGYHGTLVENLPSIRKGGFTYQYRDNHWLGQGIYFYENHKLANWFITRTKATDTKKNSEGDICIIKALLSSEQNRVLDLDSVDGVTFFYEETAEILNKASGGVTFSKSTPHKNRCFLLDIIKELHNLDIIIQTFERKDNPSYGAANTKFFEANLFPINVNYKEKQICATNNACIKILEDEHPKTEYIIPTKIRIPARKTKF